MREWREQGDRNTVQEVEMRGGYCAVGKIRECIRPSPSLHIHVNLVKIDWED